MRKPSIAVGFVALTIGVLSVTPPPASADVAPAAPGPMRAEATATPPGPDEQTLQLQVQINEYVDKIVGPSYPAGRGTRGLGGVQIDLDDKQVTFAWKGSPPAWVQRLIGDPPDGVSVSVIPAAYTRARMKIAADLLTSAAAAKVWQRFGYAWSMVGLSPAGAGLDVEAYPVTSDPAPLQSLRPRFTRLARGVTLNLSPGAKPEPLIGTLDPAYAAARGIAAGAGTRWTAASPWWGGTGVLFNVAQGTGYCTLSFTGTSGGANTALGAAHCGTGPFFNENGAPVGSAIGIKPDQDTSLIQFANGTITKNVYNCGWQGNCNVVQTVVAFPKNGNSICTGGGASGMHCNVLVKDDYTYIPADNPSPTGQGVSPVALVRQQTDDTMFANGGDSGGPAFIAVGGINMQALGINMQALGMISTGKTPQKLPDSACVGIKPGIKPKCYAAGWITLAARAVSDYGFNIMGN